MPRPTPNPNLFNIPNCAEFAANGDCTKCSFRFFNVNGRCNAVDDSCRTWNEGNGACTGCFDGY